KLARDFLKNRQPERAVKLLTKVAQHNSNASAEVLSWLARADIRAGKTNEAATASRLAIQRQPRALEGYERLVEGLFGNGQFAAALKPLDEAAANFRNDPLTLVSLADFYSIYLRPAPAAPKAAEAKGVTQRAVALLDRAAASRIFSHLNESRESL